MAVALLEQVRAAEEKADAIRRKAADQARDMLKGVQEATQEENRQYAAELRARYQELETMISDPALIANQEEWRKRVPEPFGRKTAGAVRNEAQRAAAGRKSRGADRGKGYAAWQSLK